MTQQSHYQSLVEEFESKINRPLDEDELQFICWIVKKHQNMCEDN
ncbi:hypothetical protein [Halobacillus shinanisalinarum]|nr:hypothetical protein [Halobacillus shinanisalinarum]